VQVSQPCLNRLSILPARIIKKVIIPRAMLPVLQQRARERPVVVLTGPRQSGKTILARTALPNHEYVDLADPNLQDYTRSDPREFLQRLGPEVILDGAERAPEVLDHLPSGVAGGRRRFVLIGDRGALLPLVPAGACLRLLPLAHSEIARTMPFPLDNLGRFAPLRKIRGARGPDLLDVLLAGGYPPIHGKRLAPQAWLADHVRQYLDEAFDRKAFARFVRLCAGRNGLVLNLSALAADCGITHPTARRWLADLEAADLVTLLRPHSETFGRRPFKSPRLYFLDSGLLCHLLRIRSAGELCTHSARGTVFKSFVHAELTKNFLNRGQAPALWFWREPRGRGVDFIVEAGATAVPVEAKSGRTIVPDFFAPPARWCNLAGLPHPRGVVVHGGDVTRHRRGLMAVPWSAL
jgi:uncharacterized protein